MMKFDWYQASIPEVNPNLVMSTLAGSEYYGQWVETRPLKGYDVGAQFVVGDQVLYRINHGGQNAQFGANVVSTGSSAPRLAEVIREKFPSHRVTRVDSCEDYHHADAYDFLRKKALKIAKENKVSVREIVKPVADSDDGRTLYLGSQKSAVTMRIYEKGKQLGCGVEWVRAELQIRPQKDLKSAFAVLSPEECWGLAKWSQLMAVQLGRKDLARVDAQIYQAADAARAYRWMLKQYAQVFETLKATHGSWETVGAQIGYDLEHVEDLADKVSLKPV